MTSLIVYQGAVQHISTWYYYDELGRVIGTTDDFVYTYHADGKLSGKTLASGKFVMYAYDGYGRLSPFKWGDAWGRVRSNTLEAL